MTQTDHPFQGEFEGEAVLEYSDSDFMLLKPGAYVRCAVTGDQIPLQELRYWNVDEQEAYRDAGVAAARWKELNGGPGQ
jgi:hypothetical protein